jgi:hypothetical protein
VRLGDLDCGCNDRKYIMFQAGRMGLTEGAILALAVMSIIIARKVSQ